MGNSASRIDRFYGNYEKSFERIEQDVMRLKGQAAARAAKRATVRMWSSSLVAVVLAVAVGIIYQVQQQPAGALTYQQHFNRVGGALSLPTAALLLHWLLGLGLELAARRDAARLGRLEAAKRGMLKELKDMSRFDKIKTLIDKFDPDAKPPSARRPVAWQQQQQQRQQGRPGQQPHVPALLVKGSGQVAGAAALAVAGAGRALMPLVDKLATSLISDNPILLEDLRRAQQQLQDAEVRTMGTVQENVAVKFENLDLKRRLLELEGQLNLPPSFEADALQEQHVQLVQQAQQAQQVAWQVQQGYPQQQGQTEGGAPQQQGLSSPREPLWGRGLRQDGDSSSPSTAQQAAPEAAAAAAAAAGQ